ncbi:hypothetical protein [Actinacidiphila sp. ITFR-21]|uniref:hypothetical protein n=1 Tax=Actinacidiphila sp. ITFR-21 TaxID=3075199 RepID=UPI00288C20C6|nr:hypothetical protein [Streptomyces sp. ITFR-21]WNI17687.1 hypothetical protein RLT57_20570 [Streptomyces sp. ITFR-21]WNI17827.1 hypothetical protein RLT57_21285 [Streptomyces sp. ITFR-21]
MSDTEPTPAPTPEGGAASRPKNPSQYHGHPYVWAWLVTLGATDPGYLESTCRQAEEDDAPSDAVYKYRETWITLGQVSKAEDRDRVRAYGNALLAQAAKATRRRDEQPETAAQKEAEEFEYAVTFEARFTGVVKAKSMLEAAQKLTPGEHAGPSGYVVLELQGEHGVVWHAAFDGTRGKVVTTTDPRLERPASPPTPTGPVVEQPVQSAEPPE